MIEDLKQELEKAKQERNLELSPAHSKHDGTVISHGKTLIDFTSWDLLGLNSHPKVVRATHSTIEQHGVGSNASRTSSGTTHEHLSCERRLASFLGTQAALLFPSRNQAVFTLLCLLLSERDVVVSDPSSQSPVSDAAYLVNAAAIVLQRKDPETVSIELEKLKSYRRRFLFVEGISPLTGESIDLAALSAACVRFDTNLIVDQGAAIGTAGLRGAGVQDNLEITIPPFCIIGDLGVGLGLFGGFIAGPKILTDFIVARSRAIQNEISIPPSLAAAAEEAINIAELMHIQREDLKRKYTLLFDRLKAAQIPIMADSPAAVCTIQLSKISKAKELVKALLSRGILTEACAQQTPGRDAALVRFIINVNHTDRQIEDAAQVTVELYQRVVGK